MISTQGIKLQFGRCKLFEDVNISFSQGNCYGLIGANGCGKSTFLKILSGEMESSAGTVTVSEGARISVLKQDQFAYDDHQVLMTVIMGHKRLFDIMNEKNSIYAKEDFSDKDGIKASELEAEFAEMNGWDAEAGAAKLLSHLGIEEELHTLEMKQLEASQKVRVLLAQALFGNPDILLLDEPTNQLDIETCMWLEEFLADFQNIAIVISHDRHFLDKICTHVCDIDFGKIQIYPGNYSFWIQSSELAARQRQQQNKKVSEKRKELQDFIARFSANAAKSRQATSRKKILENLNIEEIKPSSRKYPFVEFRQEREAGNDILMIDDLKKTVDGELMINNFSLHVNKGDKIAFIGRNDRIKTVLFEALMGNDTADSGNFKWGVSTTRAYFPKDNNQFFESELTVIDWLRQYAKDTHESYMRTFLGRMLFSGEESQKKVNVLSGGERVRCMLSKMMMTDANILILDEPTNHLDLESIMALNRALTKFRGTILFSSHDHEFIQTIANRIIEITPSGSIDRPNTTLDEYLEDKKLKEKREALYVS